MAEANHNTEIADYATPIDLSQKEKRIRNSPQHKAYQREYHKKHKKRIRQRQKEYYKEHPEIRKKISEKWRANNKDKIIRQQRRSKLRRCYGMTQEEYDKLLFLQGNKCAICGKKHRDKSIKSGNLHIDHCHKRGIIRGLLCNHCNSAIGFLNDDPVLLRKAADYLEATK
jgi:hypothetical protein